MEYEFIFIFYLYGFVMVIEEFKKLFVFKLYFCFYKILDLWILLSFSKVIQTTKYQFLSKANLI